MGWEWHAVCLQGAAWAGSGAQSVYRARKPEFHGGTLGCLEPWVLPGLGVARSLFTGLESRNSMLEPWAVWNLGCCLGWEWRAVCLQGLKAGIPWWNPGLFGTFMVEPWAVWKPGLGVARSLSTGLESQNSMVQRA